MSVYYDKEEMREIIIELEKLKAEENKKKKIEYEKNKFKVNPDYSLCANGEKCNLRTTCKRFLGVPLSKEFQWYSNFYQENKKCKYYDEIKI